jgi:hypothetical protein
LQNTKYEINAGFFKGDKDKGTHLQNGLKEMYHFYFHPGMPANTCAVRRIACCCEACYEQIRLIWDSSIADGDVSTQPKFQRHKDKLCVFAPVMQE